MKDDLISRCKAIDATWFEPYYTDPLNVLTEVRDRLEALPSAQPERKKGKWIKHGGMIYCSNCANGFEKYFVNDFIYCPNCGARMEVGNDE